MARPVPHVAKDGTTTWKVRYRLNGAQTSRTFTSDRGAQNFARLLRDLGPTEADRVMEARIGNESTTWTVQSWIHHHIDLLTGVQADTIKSYRQIADHQLGSLEKLPVETLSRDHVARWIKQQSKITSRRGAPLSGKTIANRHGLIAAALKRAVLDKVIASNPCDGSKLPRTERVPITFLTHAEYARLLDAIDPHYQPLVALLFGTGLRWGEATALQVGDIDLDRATVTVERAWKKSGQIGPPKTKKSRRTVPLAPELLDVLQPLVRDRRPNEFLFRNKHNNPVKSSSFRSDFWTPAVKSAALGKTPRIHDARHTYASWLLGSGVPINYVQAALGHESITTTVDTYGHIMPGAQNAIRDAMSGALTAAHPRIEEPTRAHLRLAASLFE